MSIVVSITLLQNATKISRIQHKCFINGGNLTVYAFIKANNSNKTSQESLPWLGWWWREARSRRWAREAHSPGSWTEPTWWLQQMELVVEGNIQDSVVSCTTAARYISSVHWLIQILHLLSIGSLFKFTEGERILFHPFIRQNMHPYPFERVDSKKDTNAGSVA